MRQHPPAIGIWQLVIILVIVTLLFGGKRLRSLGGDLGSTIRGFCEAVKDVSVEEIHSVAGKSGEPPSVLASALPVKGETRAGV